jgi:HAE1 family hydrophobic/amphiphilic exporter-1
VASWGSPRLALLALPLILGGLAARELPIEDLPTGRSAVVQLTTSWSTASPLALERLVTAPLERELNTLAGLERVRSWSGRGWSVVEGEIEAGRNPGVVVAEISDQVRRLSRGLPAGLVVHVSSAGAIRNDGERTVTLDVTGVQAAEIRRRLAEDLVAPRLRALDGVADVAVDGGRRRELEVALDEFALCRRGLTPAAIRALVFDELQGRSYGWLQGPGRRDLVLTTPATDAETLARRSVASAAAAGPVVRLADLARLRLQPAPAQTLSRVDGSDAVTLRVQAQPATSLVRFAGELRALLPRIESQLPAGTGLRVVEDPALPIRRRFGQWLVRLGLGFLLLLAAVAGVYRRWAPVALVGLSLATTAALYLCGLALAGLGLDRLAVLGLWAFLPLGAGAMLGLLESSGDGSTSLFERAGRDLPLRLGTLGGIAIGFALLALAGRTELPSLGTVGLVWCTTWALAWPADLLLLTVIPVVTLAAVPPSGPAARLVAALGRLPRRHPVAVLALLVVVAVPVLRAFGREIDLGEAWGNEPRKDVTVWLTFPSGTRAEQTDQILRRFESRVLGRPGVDRVLVNVNHHHGMLRVTFDGEALAGDGPLRLRESLIAEALGLSGGEISVAGILPVGYLSGFGEVSTRSVVVLGSNYDRTREVAEDFADRLRRYPGMARVRLAGGETRGEGQVLSMVLDWRGPEVRRHHLTAANLAAALEIRALGEHPDFFATLGDADRVGVRLVAAGSSGELDAALERPLCSGNATLVALGRAATLRPVALPAVIERENQAYRQRIEVLFDGPSELADDIVDRERERARPPLGYRILEFEREPEAELGGAQRALWLAMLGCGFLLTLAAVSESWGRALWISTTLAAVALGVAGAFLASWATFEPGALAGATLAAAAGLGPGLGAATRVRQWRRRSTPHRSAGLPLVALRRAAAQHWRRSVVTLATLLPLLWPAEPRAFWQGFGLAALGGSLGAALLARPLLTAVASLEGTIRRRSRAALRGRRGGE